MKKILALFTAVLLFACAGSAAAQPLEELIVSVVREEAEPETAPMLPNLDETMRAQGQPQGAVNAGGMLRGQAYLYEFSSANARVEAAWRLDAALTQRGFQPSDFIFEGASYTLYSNEKGGVLLMDGVTETTSLVVLGGDFYQEGEQPKDPGDLRLNMDGTTRVFNFAGAVADENGVTLTYRAAQPLFEGYDEVEIVFPQAEEPQEASLTLVFSPES